MALAKPKYNLQIPESISKKKLKEALELLDSGMYTVSTSAGKYICVSWIEDLGSKGVQLQSRTIQRAQLDGKKNANILDVNRQTVENKLIYIIYVYYLLTNGELENYLTDKELFVENNEKEEQEKNENPKYSKSNNENQTDTTFRTEHVLNDPNIQSSPQNKKDLSVLDHDSLTYRCLTSPYIESFYGIYQYIDRSNMKPINEIMGILKSRNLVDKWKIIELNNIPAVFDKRTLYIINKLGTGKIPSILETFIPNRFIVLCGEEQEVDEILLSPIVRAIYGKCIIKGRTSDSSSVYSKLCKILPDEMKVHMDENSENKLDEWIKNSPLPTNSDMTADFIAWQCLLENRLIFTEEKKEEK